MRTILTGVCALAMSFAGTTLAQDQSTAAQSSTDTQQTTTRAMNNKTIRVRTEVVRGRIDRYTPGKSIAVTVPGRIIKTKSFDLNGRRQTVRVATNLRRGDWVTVRKTMDDNGRTRLMVSRTRARS
jgi:hypothetical protein